MRIVLDTASLITALRSNQGAAAEVVRLIFLEKIVILMDYKIACEYRDVALRPVHLDASGKSHRDVLDLIESLEGLAKPVRIMSKFRPLSYDPNDDMVLDLAINGQANAIVTQNSKHFTAAAKQFGIAVLTPSELLTRVRKGDNDAK